MSAKASLYIGCAAVFALLVVGCGGGGGGVNDNNDGGNLNGGSDVGTAAGVIQTDGTSPENYTLMVDGHPADVTPDSDGSFELRGLPPGEHVIDAVSSDGMNAGRATFEVTEGEHSEIPPIDSYAAGQLAGIITAAESDGRKPLAGADVTARSALMWIQNRQQQSDDDQVEGSSEARPLIYPPPPDMMYKATTDETGAYQMTGVKPGPYLVAVTEAGYTAAEKLVHVQAGKTATADLTIRPDAEPSVGTINGRVVTGNTSGDVTPIRNALIVVNLGDEWHPPVPSEPIPLPDDVAEAADETSNGPDNGGEAPERIPPIDIAVDVIRTRTDDSGHYSVKVPAGSCVVSAWAYDYLPTRRQITVAAGEAVTANFTLKPVPEPPSPPPDTEPQPEPPPAPPDNTEPDPGTPPDTEPQPEPPPTPPDNTEPEPGTPPTPPDMEPDPGTPPDTRPEPEPPPTPPTPPDMEPEPDTPPSPPSDTEPAPEPPPPPSM